MKKLHSANAKDQTTLANEKQTKDTQNQLTIGAICFSPYQELPFYVKLQQIITKEKINDANQ